MVTILKCSKCNKEFKKKEILSGNAVQLENNIYLCSNCTTNNVTNKSNIFNSAKIAGEPFPTKNKQWSFLKVFIFSIFTLAIYMLIKFYLNDNFFKTETWGKFDWEKWNNFDLLLTIFRFLNMLFFIYLATRRWNFKQIGFTNISNNYKLFLIFSAFIVLTDFLTWRWDGLSSPESSIVYTGIFTSIIVAFNEEIVFRGVIYNIFHEWKGVWTAIIFSSLGFAFSHFGNNMITPKYFIYVLSFGLIFSFLRSQNVSLFCLIALHWLTDFLFYIVPRQTNFSENLITKYIGIILLILIAFSGIIIFLRKQYKSNKESLTITIVLSIIIMLGLTCWIWRDTKVWNCVKEETEAKLEVSTNELNSRKFSIHYETSKHLLNSSLLQIRQESNLKNISDKDNNKMIINVSTGTFFYVRNSGIEFNQSEELLFKLKQQKAYKSTADLYNNFETHYISEKEINIVAFTSKEEATLLSDFANKATKLTLYSYPLNNVNTLVYLPIKMIIQSKPRVIKVNLIVSITVLDIDAMFFNNAGLDNIIKK